MTAGTASPSRTAAAAKGETTVLRIGGRVVQRGIIATGVPVVRPGRQAGDSGNLLRGGLSEVAAPHKEFQ